MTAKPHPDATAICEDVLREEKRYNIANKIWPSQNIVIDRLLDRQLELVEAYSELHDKLGSRQHALKVFMSVLLSTAVNWHPDKVAQAWEGRARLDEVNALIVGLANELASLLEERERLHNHSGFADNTYYHVCGVIEDAAKANYWFGSWVRDELRNLRRRFDLKYWPRLGEFVQVIAEDAANARPEASDPITAAATIGNRRSRADFFKALHAAIAENCGGSGFLPANLKLSDATLASLANCALDLGPDDLATADYVKRLRQRQRQRDEDRPITAATDRA